MAGFCLPVVGHPNMVDLQVSPDAPRLVYGAVERVNAQRHSYEKRTVARA